MPAHAVIINADDLGLHPAVDRGIFHAWARGAIGDSSVFATAEHLPALLAEAAARGLPVGVHGNCTSGRPLSDPAEIPALLAPDGTFLRHEHWPRPLPAAQLRRELTRQVARVRALGWQPSHLDTHHHIHRYPEVWEILLDLARELRVPLRATTPEMRAAATSAGVPTPAAFSWDFYGEQATVETLIRLVDASPDGTLEIMTHPGYPAPDLASSYRAERAQELTALTDARWRDHLAAHEIAICGFGSLRG